MEYITYKEKSKKLGYLNNLANSIKKKALK